eukprot:15450845-Alexandrium_andersonii.AAC.1
MVARFAAGSARSRRPHFHLVLQPPLQRLAVLGFQPYWVLPARRGNDRADYSAGIAAQQAARRAAEGNDEA